ncbi:methyl-accepting chemotaxis protein [Methylobacterium nonmethylotrophicum]|uniref:Methyl-accepting chemotaxis protein n=1 Tax=Methylobacterium nonmethylotrophicum TaxID=1141884 RepID=A0A4Z0NQP6_9HYPH|nr:methyl-accepting chemotaxis protein [Methylobacterium nonmethylotrophicum]TGD99363.1 methyl-accepting chemotaxis protein [Methylobacterium nonmethylotrophicum]
MRLSFRPPHPPRDRTDAVEILLPLPGAGPEAEGPDRDAARAGRDAVDRVEADLVRAARALAVAARDGCAETAAAAAEAATLTRGLDALAEGTDRAGAQGRSLGAGADTLAEEAGSLAGVLVQAGRHVERADAQSRILEAEWASAAQDAARAVEAMATLARQANRLALSATVEAARAGASGGPLWQMAQEVKLLSGDAARAVEEMRIVSRRLSGPGGAATAAVAASLACLRPAFATTGAAAEAQAARARRLAGEARDLAACAGGLGRDAATALAAAGGATRCLESAESVGAGVASLAGGLAGRTVTALRQAEIGDRRVHDRYPVDLAVRVGNWGVGRVLDLGRGGLLLCPPEGCGPSPGARLSLDVRGIGRLQVQVVGASPRGLHCALLDPASEARMRDALVAVEEENRPLIAAATGGAGAVAAALEQAVSAGRLAREALFDTTYRPVAGIEPPHYLTAAVPVLEDILPPILEPLLLADPRTAFCIAVDRNGYAPVHNRAQAQAPRTGEPAWNALHARQRRLYDDRIGLSAARSTRAFLVQACPQDDSGRPPLREVSCPIRVHGRHWGALRMAFRI